MIVRILVFFCIFLNSSLLLSQNYYFKNYQVNNGLTGNTVTSILQDSDGFIWLGTRNGLNFFDGKKFKNYKYNQNQPFGLGSSSILSLYENSDRKIWVGTTRGIYIYDKATERFSSIDYTIPLEVRSIVGVPKKIWFLSNGKVYFTDPQRLKIQHLVLPYDVVDISLDHKSQMLWGATHDGKLFYVHPETNAISYIDLQDFTKGNKLSLIQKIKSLNDSTLFVGTFDRAYLAHIGQQKLENLLTPPYHHTNIQVHDFIVQNDTTYWIGSENGIYVHHTLSQKTHHIKSELNNAYSLTDNVVLNLCKDQEGGIWIGTFFGGVNFFSDHFNNFKKRMSGVGEQPLSGNIIHEITRDNFNNLWIGTEDGGLNQLNLITGKVKHYSADGKPGSISYNNIHGLLAVDDELWIGTYEHGLDVMDIKSGKVKRHYNSGDGPHDLKGNFIVSLFKTRKNEVLIATWNGLFKYDKKHDHFNQIMPFQFQVQSVLEDKCGNWWVATYGNGLFYYITHNQKYIHYKTIANSPFTVPSNYINSIYYDSNDILWISTESGLSKYNIYGKFNHFTTIDGLPDNQIFRTLEDNDGNIWISTARGLVQLNLATNKMKVFTQHDGLPIDQFNYNSSFKDADGTLYFGSIKGLVNFHPSALKNSAHNPKIYITDLKISNETIPVTSNGLLKNSILNTTHLVLPYDSTNLTFDIAMTSYSSPQYNRFKYMMKGYDDEWTTVYGNQSIHYNKLPPGSYELHLMSDHMLEQSDGHSRILHIKINPPWWASNYSYVIYTILIISVFYTIFRYYKLANDAKNQNALEQFEREKERELYNQKLDFFTNIAHEIKTPLTLIKLPLDTLLQNTTNINDETKEHLTIMNRNTNRLIDLTHQLLNFRKVESDNYVLSFSNVNICEIISEVYNDFRDFALHKNISYTLSLPRIPLHAEIDADAFRKVMTNLISNATKYCGNEVQVKLATFHSDDLLFNIEIINDGNIIPIEYADKIFNPFFRIPNFTKESGTGIGLSLARSLAQLHGGDLRYFVRNDHYNIFHLALPIFQHDTPTENTFTLPTTQINATENILINDVDEKANLLLVEDNMEIIDFLSKQLKNQFHISTAHNGLQALTFLENHTVDIIITDIMMPVMDGIELCKKVKNELAYNHIPVIMLTAKTSIQSKLEGLETGADAYLEKPFNMNILIAQIHNLLENRNRVKDYFTKSPLHHYKSSNISQHDKAFITEITKIIYDNIENIDLNVDQLSKLLNLSRPSLYRKIKALSDLTPNELIQWVRLRKAADLLAEGNIRITEVANLVGYSLPSNFSRDFNKQFGMSPSQFIENIKNS